MTDRLRIAIAGVGTVGAGLVRLVREKGDDLARRCGRPIEIVAVSARDRSRDRGVALDGIEWFDDAVAANRGSWGVGRYHFCVRTASGSCFDLYYDREPKDIDDRKGQWFLFSELACPD